MQEDYIIVRLHMTDITLLKRLEETGIVSELSGVFLNYMKTNVLVDYL